MYESFELCRLELGSLLNMSETVQNKPKLDVNNSNLYRNAAKRNTYVMKVEEVLSKMVYMSLLYALRVLNYEGLNLTHF